MPRLIDLSTGIEHQAVHEPWKPSIDRIRHDVEGVEWMERSFGVDRSQLTQSNGLGPAFEEVTAITHCGTHVDAPWHYGPTSEGGAVAKTIDECPLEWFYGDGVRLDLRDKEPGDRILVEDLENALEVIGHVLSPGEIVMLWTGRDKFLGSEEYFEQPGMTRESTLWLCERGIKVIGIDAYGFDRKFARHGRRGAGDRRRDEDLGGALRRPGARVLPDREAREPGPPPARDGLPGLVLPDQGRGGQRWLVAGGGVRLRCYRSAERPAAQRSPVGGPPFVVAHARLVVGEEHLAGELAPAAHAGLLEDALEVLLHRVR